MRGGGGGAGGQWETAEGGAAGGGDDVITIGRGGGERASVAMETAAPGTSPLPPPRVAMVTAAPAHARGARPRPHRSLPWRRDTPI